MSGHHHEHFHKPEIPLPSDRSVGLTFAIIALGVAGFRHTNLAVSSVALAIGVALASASIFAPALLRPLNIVWLKFGLILHRFVSPVVMLVLFVIAIVPFGLFMQMRADPLRKNRLRGAKSYWIERDRSIGSLSSMRNQF